MEDTLSSQGWRLGLLVARSVFEDYGDGASPWENEDISKATWYRRNGSVRGDKISARSFARQVGTISHHTVCKYLITWNKAAVDGLVPHSSKLSPGQDIKFTGAHTQELWENYLRGFDQWYLSEFNDFILDERHTPELWDHYFRGPVNPCVYFIGHKDRPDLPVKIGKALREDDRIAGLQTAHYTDLEVLLTVPGYSKEETAYHKRFASKWVAREWYQLTEEDIETIRREVHER